MHCPFVVLYFEVKIKHNFCDCVERNKRNFGRLHKIRLGFSLRSNLAQGSIALIWDTLYILVLGNRHWVMVFSVKTIKKKRGNASFSYFKISKRYAYFTFANTLLKI